MKLVPVRPLPIVWPDGEGIPGYTMLMLEWQSIVTEYEANPESPAKAWRYLASHPAFWREPDGDSMTFAAWYGPIESGYAEDAYGDEAFWIEMEPRLWSDDMSEDEVLALTPGLPPRCIEYQSPSHDDCLVVAASLAHERYGNDREFLKPPEPNPEGKWYG